MQVILPEQRRGSGARFKSAALLTLAFFVRWAGVTGLALTKVSSPGRFFELLSILFMFDGVPWLFLPMAWVVDGWEDSTVSTGLVQVFVFFFLRQRRSLNIILGWSRTRIYCRNTSFKSRFTFPFFTSLNVCETHGLAGDCLLIARDWGIRRYGVFCNWNRSQAKKCPTVDLFHL